MRWIAELFAPAVRPPILLRLDLGGHACPSTVDVETEWLPDRTRASAHVLSASSLILVPWRGDAREAQLCVRAGKHVGRAVVTRESNRDGTVLDVRLTPAL